MNESEVILHRNIDDDASNKARHHDNDDCWVVESYDARTIRAMIAAGATEKPSAHSGRVFKVDARQLIEFIAKSSGLAVEFRKHKKRQYSEETKAKLSERLRGMRQHQTV